MVEAKTFCGGEVILFFKEGSSDIVWALKARELIMPIFCAG